MFALAVSFCVKKKNHSEIFSDSKFVDDTKVGRLIRTDNDARILQSKLNLYEWVGKWDVEFSVGKCSITGWSS